MASDEVPKKIYRHVLKGLQFYHTVDGTGCTHNELVSFVFLKNSRTIQPQVVQKWVNDVLDTFKRNRILREDPFGNYTLHDAMLNGPFDNDEHFVLNPNRNQTHNENNSSQDSLSTVPHYRRVLKRKGTPYTLPKHVVYGNSKSSQ
uniref:Uncharacterized protein n=1 Tax=Anopheles culicifacies TaxID=139723 RepID=A0A182LXA1_9DIPT